MFGFSSKSWYDAVTRGALLPRPQAMTLEELLIGKRNRSHLKARLLRLGVCPNCHSQTENFAGRNRQRSRAATGL
jgi:hypothetical protein